MASTLKVNTIQHTGGTTGLTVDSSGIVDLSVNNNITMFTKNGNQDTSSQSPVTITGWAQMNSQSTFGYKQLGTAFSENSGTFTTTRLGVYRVYVEYHIQTLASAGSRYIQLDTKFTPNGGSAIGGDIYGSTGYFNSDTTYDQHTRTRIYNFNHTNDSVQFRVGSFQNIRIRGGGDTEFDTLVLFEWLAPPVA